MNPVPYDQLFAFEQNIESGFAAMLLGVGLPNPQSSRSRTVFSSPFIDLWFQNGEPVLQNQTEIPGQPGRFFPFNTYTGVLTTECVTNRQDTTQPAHTLLIAKLRGALQMFQVARNWTQYQEISLILDIREGGTLDTWEDDNGLDHTTITWNVVHSINADAWPAFTI